MTDVKVISAKVSPELFDKMEEVRDGLGIPTRNEVIIRAIRMYYANYRFAIEHDNTTE
jgi:Predicted transcriptional regulators containing the CopG/Arc/MetJ DNA-binding domain and a metal-binding domain